MLMCGRQILDAPLVDNKVVDVPMRRNYKGIMLKLDFEIAYDMSVGNFSIK